jgi:hypothetical protein
MIAAWQTAFFQLRTAVSLKTKSAYDYGDEYHKTGT